MHFFNSRFRTLFEERNHKAQINHLRMNQRSKNTLVLDYIEGTTRICKFYIQGGD